jgi:hypothetical protein
VTAATGGTSWPTWLAFVALLVVAALVALWIVRRDPKWRRVRVGLFLERERFGPEHDELNERLERGFNDD